MDGPIESSSSQGVLPTPRTSLQNIGKKQDEDEKARGGDSFQAFGADGFTFLDFLDIINPLQHIPIVGTVYRSIAGDDLDPGSRIAGGTLFGGPVGAAVSVTNVVLEHNTGQDMGDRMMAWFSDEDVENLDDGEGVKLANSPLPADFVTAAGGNADKLADATSPITANAEVLDWARREMARGAGIDTDEEARLKSPEQAPPVGSVDVAANIEVLNWARREAAMTRSAVENADTGNLDRNRAERQTRADTQQAANSNTIAMGRNQSQLAGATAPLGGWFSETMLLALAKYDDGAQLKKATVERHVEETVDISE